MREVDSRHIPSRVRGRGALEQSVRRLLIRTHRYRLHRAVARADRDWAARTMDSLRRLLDEVPPEPRP